MKKKSDSLTLHAKHRGKIAMCTKVPIDNADTLSWAYSPGVAEPCLAIANTPDDVFLYTNKQNTIAIVTDGSAVLGLGDIGPDAALPVMEGKAALFKTFADIDAIPICLDVHDVEGIVNACKAIAPTFNGINLEDIAAPQCFSILKRLEDELSIPVFHDDQDGTAIVTLAALINAATIADKPLSTLRVVVCGMGAAGTAIVRLLHAAGVKTISAYDKDGFVHPNRDAFKPFFDEGLLTTRDLPQTASLVDVIDGTNVFIGVSTGDLLTPAMIRRMGDKPIVFAMANPTPEIDPQTAKAAGAFIVGTGRSDHANQINNVLAFPGVFRGALDARKHSITQAMKLAAANAIAALMNDDLHVDRIIPSPFDARVVDAVAKAIRDTD